MSFICQNADCPAPESKKNKVYPAAMECPFCDVPLVEMLSFKEDELNLISQLPYVIAYPLKRTLSEKHAWTKINLLKDSFLNYLKYLGLITASEFFNSPIKDKRMVALFQQALAEPSFGSWNQYIREILLFLQEQKHPFFCEDLLPYYKDVESGKKRKLYKREIQFLDNNGDIQFKKQEATGIGMLINFRNHYLGHGLTLDEKDSKKLWDDYYPIFKELLEKLGFSDNYPMFKHEHGETYLLQSSELVSIEKGSQTPARVWIENNKGESMDILPFFVVPGELSIAREEKEQILTYESYTGKTIKFFSPEGTEKQTSGKILERLNLLLRDKQKEEAYSPEQFTKEVFLARIAAENNLIIDTLVAEKKVIPGVYVHREEMEIKLREWIGARAGIFFITAEAGSGKTNLLVEMQQQYASRDLPSLLIRAARMEKPSLQEQLCYLLNMDSQERLSNYLNLAGNQDSPTFILLDGLNEANQPEAIWQEILEICRIFPDGRLKFIVTSRANTTVDVERYALPENKELLVYGDKKEGEMGLRALTHWLTPLNMNEMKSAWEDYAQKDRNRFKPQFSFDDLATFDRGIYEQISNPLVLRLFLETYHGKALPKNIIGHLNIWQDWLATFSKVEQSFLALLAEAVWEKGENELLLDDLLKDEKLKPYFTTDLINAPYPRLKNNGWISRYTKDLNAVVSFAVEGSLLFLIGQQLAKQMPALNLQQIQNFLSEDNKLKTAALESFLCQISLSGDLTLVTDLIDAVKENSQVYIGPLLIHLKLFGAKSTLEKVLQHPSENDWKALYELDKKLNELELVYIRKYFLNELMQLNSFETKEAILLGLEACKFLDRSEAEVYLEKIIQIKNLITIEADIQRCIGDINEDFGEYKNALIFYFQSLDILFKETKYSNETNNYSTPLYKSASNIVNHFKKDETIMFYQKKPNNKFPILIFSQLYSSIGNSYLNLGMYDDAWEYYQKCLEIKLQCYGARHIKVASSYYNFGNLYSKKGEYNKALEYSQKCLEIEIESLGEINTSVASTYNIIGVIWFDLFDYDKSIEFYQKSLKIRKRILGSDHHDVAYTINNIGLVLDRKGKYDEAIENYEESLNILKYKFGDNHPNVATILNNIGNSYLDKENYEYAIEYYLKTLEIRLNVFESTHPDIANTFQDLGNVYHYKRIFKKAQEFYEKCLDIRLKSLGENHPLVADIYHCIGLNYNIQEYYNEALEFHKKCLEIRLNIFESNHSEISITYDQIGSNLMKLEQYNDAIIFFNKCLEIDLINFGPEHPDVAHSYSNIGYVLEKINEQEQALSFYIKSATIRKINPDLGLEAESTQASIQKAKQLAMQLGKLNDLPDWMNE
jgi:tetratricopeptide (TPR) repeat protein